jgi:protocatechuate 3,4-dioxygenase beta subunit
MVKISALLGLVALLASTPLTLAHGAGESGSALVKRQEFVDTARRSVAECQSKLKARHLAAKRRAKRDAFLQERHGKLQSRAVQTSDPFNDTIPTCILAPEEEVGPYYVSGELIRDDVREDQEGIDLLVDVQVFDVATCTVLPNVMVDFWSCNSTGVYSGVEAEDTLGLTFLRGLVESDEDGIVQLTTKVNFYQG